MPKAPRFRWHRAQDNEFALVNAGRKPLAEALGVVLPHRLADERRMWRLLSTLHRRPYQERAAALDAFRAAPPAAEAAPPTA
ncbi:hypothetical protein [Streptomyces sp. NPDC101150]|uniref:hypothetical protein n=1 Tax=Streptomyces sp. NPDC101150 TaxID=3366114 RepID=UPI00380967C5